MTKMIAVILFVALVLAGCNMPQAGPVVVPTQPQGNQGGSSAGDATQPIATIDLSGSVNATLTAMFTPLPTLPQETSTPIPTFTSSVPRLSVTTATNCRIGPGLVYDRVGGLQVGETAEIIGRDPSGQYWYVRDTESPTGFCWLWANYATPVGNYSGVPIFTPPPTPTPSPSFVVRNPTVLSCAGQFAYRFEVENNGSTTWESIQIVVTDNTTATSTTHSLDAFRSYNGCVLEASVDELGPGEGANTATINPGQIGYNPAGHSISAVIRLCSAEGLAGTCANQNLNFTP